MSYIIDALIIFIGTVSVLIGYERGFIKCFFKSFGLVTAVILSVLLTRILSPAVEKRFVKVRVYEKVNGIVADKREDLTADELLKSLDEKSSGLEKLSSSVGINTGSLIDRVRSQLENESSSSDVSEKITAIISPIATSVLLFVPLCILVYLALYLIYLLLRSAVKLSRLGKCDRVFGGLFGIVSGYINITLFVFIIAPALLTLLSLWSDDTYLASQVENSIVMKFMKEHNLISIFF